MNDDQYRWEIVENIATIAATVLLCWLVSAWFAFMLLNLNYRRGEA